MQFGQILAQSAFWMNDQLRTFYTDEVLLPCLNAALTELQEIFQLNSIPVTTETSHVITVPQGATEVGFTTSPALPTGLIEIIRLFESPEGLGLWVPVTKKNTITAQVIPDVALTYFGIWAWNSQKIKLLALTNNQDIKFDYVKNIFSQLTESNLNQECTIIGADSYLYYRTAAFAAQFIAEDEIRAEQLLREAAGSLVTSVGISVKGMQSIMTRRRPFRARFKANRRVG